jgi:hypothetical protein
MTMRGRRDRVETTTLLLGRARWLLETLHSRFILLADIAGARTINRIITDVETERQRWLEVANNPLP